jgi:hypothetical protein
MPPTMEPPWVMLDDVHNALAAFTHVAVGKPVGQISTSLGINRVYMAVSRPNNKLLKTDLQLIMMAPSAAQKIPAVIPQAAAPRYTNHSVPYRLFVYSDAAYTQLEGVSFSVMLSGLDFTY